ncbi:MAG TPA: LysM domain-containing protein [Gaiellaceae bacterium]|nr:LysM domain-containing protein [Gaiellaceae bacterium]
MRDSNYRTWIYRLAAPAAFFLAATVLVVLIERGLSGGSAATTTTAAQPTTSVSVETVPGTSTTKKKKQVYHVKVGDTLESIANKFETTVDDLLALNPGIDPLALSPGQKIRVA